MTLYLIVGRNIELRDFRFEKEGFIVGLDRGALIAVKSGIRLNLAYGDFDSVTDAELSLIRSRSDKLIRLSPQKDDTDTMGAYRLMSPKAERTFILGGIQGLRIEHFLANLNLVAIGPKTVLCDDSSVIVRLDASPKPYAFSRDAYRFYSFFAVVSEAVISLVGFRYPLSSYHLLLGDSLCISNELKGDTGSVLVSSGSAVLIKSKDDR